VQSLPDALITVARTVIDAILRPLATPIPTTPASSPILLAVEWFRRTTVGMFYNRGPSAAPLQIGEDANGTVVGTLAATDPDGDPLNYTVAGGPTRGTVAMAANGTYTYTPDAALARDGGTDTFTISVSDGGVRLLSQPGRTSVTVTVDVGAGDSLAVNGSPFAVAMSPDGTHAYVTDAANSRVSIVDVATRAVTGSIVVGTDPSGIAIASDGRAYVVNAGDGTVTVFDTVTNRIVRPYVYVGSAPNGIAVNDAGTRVVVANSFEDSVSVIDTRTWNVTRVVVGDGPYGVAISGDRALVTNEYDDTVSAVDLTTNAVVATIAVGDSPTGIAAAGNCAVVTNAGTLTTPGDGTVSIIDLDSLSVVGSPIALGDSPVSVVIDATGTHAYIADVDRSTVSVLDIAAGTVSENVYPVAGGPTGLALGADGSLYVAGYLTGSIDPVEVEAPVQPAAVGTPVFSAAASTATAGTAPAAAATQEWSTRTKGFDLYNDTAQNLTISYGSDFRPNGGGPAEGTVLAPGAHLHLEIPATFWGKEVELVLTGPTDESWTVSMDARSFFGIGVIAGDMRIAHSGGSGTSDPTPDWHYGHLLFDEKTTVRLLDKQGTVNSYTAGDPEAAKAFAACWSGSRAICSFQPAGDPTQFWTDWQIPTMTNGQPAIFRNGMDEPEPGYFPLAITQSGKVSDGLGVKAGLAVASSVIATIKTPTGQQLSSTKTYIDTPTYMAPRISTLTLQMRSSWLRYSGNMTITVGNSIVTVTGLVFDVPDPNRGLEYATTSVRGF
jgi:YVTN family beta-propeller protein